MDNKSLTKGIILIVLGLILLLGNLGYISFDILFNIFDLWPLLLVIAGINILFNKKPIINIIAWVVFFIILIVYGGIYGGRNIRSSHVGFNTSFTKPVETSHGQFALHTGAAQIDIDSGDRELLKVNGHGNKLDYSHTFRNNNELAIFNFTNKNDKSMIFNNRTSKYNFELNENIIWDLGLDLGAISGTLNFEDIPVKNVDLNIGAGNLQIILGEKHNKTNFKIDGGVSNLKIAVPRDAGIRIRLDGALNKIDLDELGLTRTEDYYISPNYEEKDTKLDFHINMGLGKVKFKHK